MKTPKMGPIRHRLFPATLRPASKTGRAVLAALTMALPVFSVGFGNIFILSARIPTPALQDRKKSPSCGTGEFFSYSPPAGLG